MTKHAITMVAAIMIAIVFAACDDTDEPSAESSPTSPAATSVPAPSIITEIEDAVASGDPAQLESLIEFRPVACIIEPQGIGAPPFCAEGEPEGTLVDAVLLTGCEGSPSRREDVVANSLPNLAGDHSLWAAYEYTSTAVLDGASYYIIFERPEPFASSTGFAFTLSETGIIAIHFGCGWSPQDFARFNELGAPIVGPSD